MGNKPRMLSEQEKEDLRQDLKDTIRRLRAMPYQRRPGLTPEQLEDVKRDLVAGKTRGQVCKDRGYTYQQLQRALGFAWKKKADAAQEIVEPETVN